MEAGRHHQHPWRVVRHLGWEHRQQRRQQQLRRHSPPEQPVHVLPLSWAQQVRLMRPDQAVKHKLPGIRQGGSEKAGAVEQQVHCRQAPVCQARLVLQRQRQRRLGEVGALA